MADCTSLDPETDIPPAGLIDIPDGLTTDVVTEGCVDGNGIYDVFMKAHMDAIHQEYAKQRIKGSEYSKVYLGGMQAAMQSAVGYALGRDKAAAEAELAKYAVVKAQADILLLGEQICKTQKEIELLEMQKNLFTAQTWAEIAKTTPSIAEFMQELTGTTPILDGPATVHEDSTIGAQVGKVKRENFLLRQKEQTEQAQIANTVGPLSPDGIVGTKTDVKGVLLKEKNLLQRQADGFVRDAEAKSAKIIADAHSIEFSTLDGEGEELSIEGTVQSAKDAFLNVQKVHSAEDDLIST